MANRSVFVIGQEPFNFDKLTRLRDAKHFQFSGLFRFDEVQSGGIYPLPEIFAEAVRRLDEATVPVDGIMGYWDFPVTPLVPLLSSRYGTPSPTLEAVTKCEHKYWSRVEQAKVIPEATPAFCAVDPFDDQAISEIALPFPFWLKPIKSHSSQLGFRIHGRRDLRRALQVIRKDIRRFADPFAFVLERVTLPKELEHVDGSYCIAEEIISGRQCTVEGFVYQQKPEVYAIIDSIRHKNGSSFSRYQYPSKLPRRIQERVSQLSKSVMSYLGYDSGTFNIEYFWNPKTDAVKLIEINPRLSQSHSDITEKVDGVPNLDKMVKLAVGKRPELNPGAGPDRVAAKCFLRHFEDTFVRRVPSQEQVRRIEERWPGVRVEICANPGQCLSTLQNQDSYSFELAIVHLGAKTERNLNEKYRSIVSALEPGFEFIPVPGPAEPRPPSRPQIRSESPSRKTGALVRGGPVVRPQM